MDCPAGISYQRGRETNDNIEKECARDKEGREIRVASAN